MVIFSPSPNSELDLEDVGDTRVKRVCRVSVSNTWDSILSSEENEDAINNILDFFNDATPNISYSERREGLQRIECYQFKSYPISLEPEKVANISLRIHEPPSQVRGLHKQVMEGMRRRLESQEIGLREGEGPVLVTAVNSSRVLTDVRRDLARVKGIKEEHSFHSL